jgi:hypothetical protein
MELTLKEIDECKKAIDKNLAFHKTRIDAIKISSDKEAKKQELESARSSSTVEMNTVLEKYGFNSVIDFYIYYGKRCFESYKECNPPSGECNWCGESSFGLETQKCYIIGKSLACGLSRPSNAPSAALKWALKCDAEGTTIIKDGIKTHNVCPEGQGFYIKEKDCKDMPKELDITWRYKTWLHLL